MFFSGQMSNRRHQGSRQVTTVLPPVAALELTYRCNHACRFCSCPWFAGMIKPSAEMSVDEWKRLVECEEWMHFVRHDYLPEMCAGCARVGACMGGCREAARVFRGSPTAPDPLMAG